MADLLLVGPSEQLTEVHLIMAYGQNKPAIRELNQKRALRILTPVAPGWNDGPTWFVTNSVVATKGGRVETQYGSLAVELETIVRGTMVLTIKGCK